MKQLSWKTYWINAFKKQMNRNPWFYLHTTVESSILFVFTKFRKIHQKWVFLNFFMWCVTQVLAFSLALNCRRKISAIL